MRTLVVGTSGAGKSTFARELARLREVPYVELDELHWGPDWAPRPAEAFLAAVDAASRGEGWVVDGNYSAVRHLLWPRASEVVWLNFSRTVIARRILWRTFRRALLREPLWHGNREQLRKALFSHQSILLWSFTSYRRNVRKYEALRQDPAYAHLRWNELRTPAAAASFLAAAASQL